MWWPRLSTVVLVLVLAWVLFVAIDANQAPTPCTLLYTTLAILSHICACTCRVYRLCAVVLSACTRVETRVQAGWLCCFTRYALQTTHARPSQSIGDAYYTLPSLVAWHLHDLNLHVNGL